MSESTTRTDHLRQMLEARRRVLHDAVQGQLREGRRDQVAEVQDLGEQSDAGLQAHLALTLLQMQGETLTRIDDALARLAGGSYGWCATCRGEIASARLLAMPFAVRCRECEEHREQAKRIVRRDTMPVFAQIPGT